MRICAFAQTDLRILFNIKIAHLKLYIKILREFPRPLKIDVNPFFPLLWKLVNYESRLTLNTK